jgi:hypothetical protein
MEISMSRNRCFVAIAAAALLAASASRALINPRFTPIQLVKQAALVVAVDVKQGASKDQCVLAVRETLKGKAETNSITVDLTKARDEQSAEALRKLVADGKPTLFFVGEFAGDGGAAESRGLLHISGQWASCVRTKEGVWLYDAMDQGMQAVWAGGTDMLRRVVDYIVRDDEADVPVAEGVSWSGSPEKIATLDGAIKTVRLVDLAGDGQHLLFVARDKGDRLLSCDPKTRKFADVTADRGLQSKSLAYAWGDFSGQGRLDLVSYDGKTVTLHAQQADGRFKSGPLDLGKALDGGCVGLTALDTGVKERAGLLVNGNVLPVLVVFDAEAKASATALTAPGIDLAKQGKAGACLVGDFDGDGYADILALREEGGILFCGEAPGKFKPGIACAAQSGNAATSACTGDYDGDGCLDVLVFGGTTRFIWVNNGKGSFTERFCDGGEMLTHNQNVRGSDCMTGDVNNDGRQDVLVAYANASPVTYFSRGFLSFGHSHAIDVGEQNLLPDAKDGQQSACLADVDGDGAQDMVLALNNGEIWVLFRENSQHEARMAVAALPLAGACKGPMAVTGWIGKRCLGAWNVLPGVSQASFGRTEAGPVTLTWRLPGGKEQTQEVVLEKGGTVKVEIK